MLLATAYESAISIVAYLGLFAALGFGFIFVNLLVGYFLRPADPHEEKQEIYECGEPTIGSSFVQFDLRFYVVALVFIIFDVEVAFLFPWATVFGKATNMMHTKEAVTQVVDGQTTLAPVVADTYRELGIHNPVAPAGDVAAAEQVIRAGAGDLAQLALVAGTIFFAVLFVGFAYEWKTGALDWVKSIRAQHDVRRSTSVSVSRKTTPQESVLSV